MLKFNDLRQFVDYLESIGELKRISYAVDPDLEITAIADRVLRAGGPALLFENPIGYDVPVLANLFGTTKRVALGMGQTDVSELQNVGKLLAFLKEPEPPKGFSAALATLPLFRQVLNMPVKKQNKAACQEIVWQDDQVNLDKLPIMRCWQDDVAPLMTWGLTITQGPNKKRQNLGIYRQQKLSKNKIIMRWLAHRGGALDLRDWMETHPNKPFPVSVAFGADPATILAAVTPVPDSLSEYAFAGLLRGAKTKVVKSISNHLHVPASAEIVLEGYIDPNEYADEGPYGDHTGYYNEVERHHVFTVTHVTMRQNPIYHSTYTGRPPDEPAILGVALNQVFVPILQKQFSEIVDFYLPPEGCSYRLALVKIKKQYPGHAKRVMMGVWSFLRQFMYTKLVIVCDEDVDLQNWESVCSAIADHWQPGRDCLFIHDTPIDSLDFASPEVGLGGKIGLDATKKWPVEQNALPASQPNVDLLALKEQIMAGATLNALYLPAQAKGKVIIASIAKQYHGQGREVIAKILAIHAAHLIIVCDQDIDVSNWQDIIWAVTTRMDPVRDSVQLTHCVGFDATHKLETEVSREWGRPIEKNQRLEQKIDSIWPTLGL